MESTVKRTLKTVAALTAATALAVVLVACSDESDKSSKQESSTEAAKTETAQEKPADAGTSGSGDKQAAATTDDQAETKTEASDSQAEAPSKKASVKVPEADGTVDMAEVLKPGPLPEMSLGSADAPVKIVEYMSMTCPHCAHFHKTTFHEIVSKYVDTGKVQFIVREFPFDPRAAAAIMLARCAPNGNYFPMVDVLFKQQETWARAEDARAALLNIAKLAGFTQESFEACLTDQKLADDVNAVMKRGATEFEVSATPTFLINGKRYSGAMSVDQMSAIIDSDL
jgi:protein-disulfide isomerase